MRFSEKRYRGLNFDNVQLPIQLACNLSKRGIDGNMSVSFIWNLKTAHMLGHSGPVKIMATWAMAKNE